MSNPPRSSQPSQASPPGFAGGPIPPTPRVVPSWAIAILWVVVAMLLALGLLAWRMPVPTPIRGLAVRLDQPEPATAVLLPEAACEHVTVGTWVRGEPRWAGKVLRVEPSGTTAVAVGVPATIADDSRPLCIAWIGPLHQGVDDGPTVIGLPQPVRAIVERTALSLWWDDATTMMPPAATGAP
ncbi:MAG: hypothetical protein K0V04_41995 [Deltaproteobacteria bacterium]|nr:hypothetical protein [Deltaproteobacteria bacterium]